ncbi:sulfite oxidase [Dyadobacter tibetensis]|uniref:sulfite oxidase n=1 Tax=Dyadobacter tibetensis TaxID=1211851 RepID=UPI000471757E|nr:sulfite oxidase [Dyadobacter tibetensis]
MTGPINRRGFIKKSGLAALTAAIGTNIVYANHLPEGFRPVIFDEKNALAGKSPELIIRGERPWNVESLPHLLDERVTSAKNMFIRNNGLSPEKIDLQNWKLTIDGESVRATKSYTLADLKKRFKQYTYQLVLECGGNGRSGYQPQTSGNQWDQGAVHCAEWTGVRLKDVLKDVGIKEDAVYIGYHSADAHLSKDPAKEAISRGVPIAKALEDETLIAWKLNGEDIPAIHGFPLRLVVGGWPASTSGKWLERISIRNKVHDGAKMTGHSYRVPRNPVVPGESIPETDEFYKIIESMPVKSLITYPKTGAIVKPETKIDLRGHAWAGDLKVTKMEVSIDFGATWQECELEAPANRLAWQHWKTTVQLPQKGYYEVWARATDEKNVAQPMVIPTWNPGGYINNACERIAMKAE